MAEQQGEQVWRVVTHERGGDGSWIVWAEAFADQAVAEQWAAWAVRQGGCSNAGAYAEMDGRVHLPRWIKVREGAGT